MSATAQPVSLVEQAFIGRQAIYDRNCRVFGYELLYRAAAADRTATFRDGDNATAEVIVTTFLDIGLERICADRHAFINLTRSYLVEGTPLPFPPERTVIEILEDVTLDDALLANVARLRREGYTLALDDYRYDPDHAPLLDLIHIVKIDVRALSGAELREHFALLKPRGLRLLAEKVESEAEFREFHDLGFDYFQGYFLAHPKLVTGRRLPPNRLNTLHLLARLQDPDIEFEEIEAHLARDPSLSLRLLRYINSAAVGMRRHVDSLQRAVMLLGLLTLKRWISVLALTADNQKPRELVRTALTRARMSELLCAHGAPAAPGPCFTVGLFSTLDALLDAPLDELLAELPLTGEVKAALLEHEGPIGEVLDCVLRYERCDFEHARLPGLGAPELRAAYVAAVDWSFKVTRDLDI